MGDRPSFKIGETVRLRVDGSPIMIVEGIESDGRLLCTWTDGAGNRKSQAFPAHSVRAAAPTEDGRQT